MNRINRVFGLLLILVCSCSNSLSKQNGHLSEMNPAFLTADNAQYVEKEYLVTVKAVDKSNEERIKSILENYMVLSVRTVSDSLYLIKLKSDPGMSIVSDRLKRLDFIEAVQRNFIYRVSPFRKKKGVIAY